jgi:hypothetical protein
LRRCPAATLWRWASHERRSRGRPQGSKAAFLNSPRQFEVAIWLAATSNGMADYAAANLAVVLIRTDEAITAAWLNESV